MSKKKKHPDTKQNTESQNIDIKGFQERIGQLEEQLKKALADYQNLQRQQERQKEALLVMVRRDIFKDLIDLFSDLSIATKAIDKVDENNPWLTGILQIMQKYQDLLKRHGVTEISFNPGDPVDYENAQIVGTIPEGTSNTVAQTTEAGYKVGEFLIVPAKIIVYTGTTSE